MVFNADETGFRGTHWVAMFIPLLGPLEYFDPLGQKPETYRTYFRSCLEAGNRGSCETRTDTKIMALPAVANFASTTAL